MKIKHFEIGIIILFYLFITMEGVTLSLIIIVCLSRIITAQSSGNDKTCENLSFDDTLQLVIKYTLIPTLCCIIVFTMVNVMFIIMIDRRITSLIQDRTMNSPSHFHKNTYKYE